MSFSGKPTTLVEQHIDNDGFWPDLSVSEFQKGYRLPGEYLGEMLVADLTTAMVEINTELDRVKIAIQAAGISRLNDAAGVTSPAAWGYGHKVLLYKRAVTQSILFHLLTRYFCFRFVSEHFA